MKANVLRLAQNQQGRDFVVGDIHGEWQQLTTLLTRVNFNTDNDRLLAVGDIIDRGPDSLKLVELLKQPWFYCCRGNHEDVLLRYCRQQDQQLARNWQGFGGEWFFQLNHEQQDDVYAAVNEHTVLAIEVETLMGLIGVVHADVPVSLSWPEITQALQQADADMQEWVMWSRARIKAEKSFVVHGIERLFVGHTIVKQSRHLANVHYIDTGAFTRSQRSKGLQNQQCKEESSAGHLTLIELAPDYPERRS